MPLDLQIIRLCEFVRLGARGDLDFELSKEALRQIAQACRKRGIDRALLDLRELPVPERAKFTPTELAALINTFHEAGFTRKQRLAVLYRTDPHHGAHMFAFIGRLRGWKVAAFPDFQEAVSWLSDDSELEQKAAEPSETIAVPIRKPKIQITEPEP